MLSRQRMSDFLTWSMFLIASSQSVWQTTAFFASTPQQLSVSRQGRHHHHHHIIDACPWGASPAPSSPSTRTRGIMHSLIINPKRQGVTQVGIEDIKAKKMALQAPHDLRGKVFVSGTVDEEVFTLLNDMRVWTRITAFAQDPVSARKRLTSRTTRYSGVLDLLHIEEGDFNDLGQLESYLKGGDYSAWLDVTADADPKRLLAKAKLVAAAGIKFFVTAITLNEEHITKQDLDLEPIAKALGSAGVKFRILVSGPVIEAPATGFVRMNDTNFLQPNSTITRGDLSRVATEFFLVTEKQNSTAIYVSEGDETVVGYLRYCREQGMNYKMEITDQLQGGLYSYKDKVSAIMQAEADKAAGILSKGAKKDTQIYADYRLNVTKAGIATEFEKKRRTLVGMVKKIVNDILEEEYDDMYYSMRTKEDLDLYKKSNWQRAVNLVLGMLMGEERSKDAQRMTGFQDPYLGPQWHIIRSNAAVMVKIKELYDEIGDRITKFDWERYDLLEGDFLGDEEAVLTMKIEEKTKRNKNYLRETLIAPPRRKASLVVETEEIASYRDALKQALDKGRVLPPPAETPATAATDDVVEVVTVEVVNEPSEPEPEPVAVGSTKRGRKSTKKGGDSSAATESSSGEDE